MTCNELQNILYSIKTDELYPYEKESIEKHLATCKECATIYQNILEADRILTSIKVVTPRARNEQALTESIMTAIVSGSKSVPDTRAQNFLDQLIELFSIKTIRFACVTIILLCGITYVLMDYNDTKAIVTLEQRFGKKNEVNHAFIFQQEINTLNFINELYGLLTGTTSSVELTNTLILIKKADLYTMMQGYQTLDKSSQARLNEIWKKYKEEESLKFSTSDNREEITALRNEVERLRRELEHSTHKKELQ
jgi:hypothetical protein